MLEHTYHFQTIAGPYSLGIGNLAGWLPMTVVSPNKYEKLAAKLESQNHTTVLPEDTHPTVIAVGHLVLR